MQAQTLLCCQAVAPQARGKPSIKLVERQKCGSRVSQHSVFSLSAGEGGIAGSQGACPADLCSPGLHQRLE